MADKAEVVYNGRARASVVEQDEGWPCWRGESSGGVDDDGEGDVDGDIDGQDDGDGDDKDRDDNEHEKIRKTAAAQQARKSSIVG